MSGKPGRSGVAHNAEELAAKRAAASLGAAAKTANRHAEQARLLANSGAVAVAEHPAVDGEEVPKPSSSPANYVDGHAGVQLAFRRYYDAQRSRLALLERQSELFTADAVRQRDDAWNLAAATGADEVAALLSGIEGITPEQRAAFTERARAWRKAFGARLAKAKP